MLHNYIPILVFLVISLLMSGFIFVASRIFARILKVNRPNAQKLAPYECGFGEFSDARMKFDVRFYLVAILFIIFDLEVAFLFPWAVVMKTLPWAGILAMGGFIFLLVIGFIYEWKKGALEWE